MKMKIGERDRNELRNTSNEKQITREKVKNKVTHVRGQIRTVIK
jgi:hypothetical protein